MKVDKNKIQKNNFGAGTYRVIFLFGTCRDTNWDLSLPGRHILLETTQQIKGKVYCPHKQG